MASKRYLQDKSSTVLWYLSRACYHKAVREQSFADLRRAIEIGQMVGILPALVSRLPYSLC